MGYLLGLVCVLFSVTVVSHIPWPTTVTANRTQTRPRRYPMNPSTEAAICREKDCVSDYIKKRNAAGVITDLDLVLGTLSLVLCKGKESTFLPKTDYAAFQNQTLVVKP